jgi:DNA-3-methyladenine glycosylase
MMSSGEVLPQSFYARDAESVAKELLGQILIHEIAGERRAVRIVETEAYVGTHDLACHASKGRTPRTDVMFGPPGYAYVYLIYGMYDLFNIVTGPEGDAQAVLIRAGEPLEGIQGRTDGPGKLARALQITRRQNRQALWRGTLFFEAGTPPEQIITTTRIGVDYAGDWKDAPLRFYDAGAAYVSKR